MSAAQPEVELRSFAPDIWEEDPETKKTVPPKFRAVVKEASAGLGDKDFTLKQIDLEEPVSVKAERVVGYAESDEPMVMVILVQGQGRWMGNEEYTDIDSLDYSEGAWKGVPPAIDALAQAGPPGSVGALLVYHDSVDVLVPTGDVSKLTGSALGPQENFKAFGRSFVAGLNKAATLLSEQTGKRRILVVIGDGEGQKDDISGDIRNVKKKLQELDVEVYTIQYYAKPSPDAVGQRTMKELGELGNAQSVATRENFRTTAESFVTMIGNRYYVDFPGWNEKAEVYFSHDGTDHEFLVQVGEEELEPLSGAVTTLNWKVPSKGGGGSLWWLWLIIILLLLVVGVILFLKWRAGREEVYQPEEPMMPMDEAPPPAPEPAPMKTMMLGIGGNDEGFPIVGWVVPLTGPNQYQTFKLRQGVTKLGSGVEADVIIQDQFMSTTHAEIVCSPAGFLLKDGGSTNGTYVNEKRVDTHELVDNDVFSMGKTDFKFKSIN